LATSAPLSPLASSATGSNEAGWVTTTVFDNHGQPTAITVPPNWTKSYDSQGFLIIPTPTPTQASSAASQVQNPHNQDSLSSLPSSTLATSAKSTISAAAVLSANSGSPSSTGAVTSTSATGASVALGVPVVTGLVLGAVVLLAACL
jgi:hypothetical protein